jgi:tetratricopeptide (TPR) repeat protein
MPTINRKLLLRLFIITIILGGGLFLLHYVQADRATDALRWQAERAAENGKLDKAILYMRMYLELRPEDHDAVVKLGDLILTRGSTQRELSSALFLFERVVREAPQRDDVRRKVLDVCLKLMRYSDATIHAKALVEKSPADADLLEKYAICLAAQTKYDEAQTLFEKAIKCDPTRVGSYELLVELLLRQLNRPNDARSWIEKLVTANPASAEAHIVSARYWRGEKKLAECQRELDKVREIEPANADLLLISAELLQEKGEIGKARAELADGLGRYPKDIRFYRLLSWLELSAGNLPAATVCLEQGVKELPNATELLTPLGDLYVQQGDLDKVDSIIKKLESRRAIGSQVKYLRGRLLMQRGKWSEAAALFDGLRIESVAMPGLASQVNYLQATCYERLGDRPAQTEALKRVLQIDVGHLQARLKFAAFHLAAGRLDDAIKEYTVAARSSYAPLGVRIMLGRLLIARARSAGPAADWNGIAEYAQSLREKYAHAVEPLVLCAELFVARRQPDKATELLRAEAGKHLNDPRIWSVLAAIALESEGLYAALDVIDEAQGLIGDQVELRLARARAWASDWQAGREAHVRDLGKGADNFSDGDQLQLFSGLADACAACGDIEGIKLFQSQLALLLPRDLAIRRALLETAMRTGDKPLAKRMRGELTQIGGDAGFAAVADALATVYSLATADPKLTDDTKLAKKILAQSPDRADAHLLAATVAAKSNDRSVAAREFTLAIELEPASLSIMRAQIVFLIGADEAAAKARLEQLYFDPRLPGDSFLALIGEIIARTTPEQADRCLNWVTPLVSDSGASLLQLARLDQKRARAGSALNLIDRAIAANPKMIDAWAARIRLKSADFAATLDKARAALDDPGFFMLCAEVAGEVRGLKPDWSPPTNKPEQARLATQAFVTVLAARGKSEEATAELTRFANDKQTRPEDVAWAKRSLAALAISRGNAAERRQAIAALIELAPDAKAPLAERRGYVMTLAGTARRLNAVERKPLVARAVEALKIIVADKDASANDWHRLAQFHQLAGDRASRLECLKEALKRDPKNVYFLVACVEELLDDGKFAEVEPYLPRLREADDSRALAALTRHLVLADQPAKAQEAIEQYILAADSGGTDGVVRLRIAAELLDQLARLAAARKLPSAKTLVNAASEKFRRAMANRPDAAAPLAALMAFDNQVPAAFDLLTSMKSSMSAKVFTTAGIGVLRSGRATPRQFQLVKSWLDAALKESPNSSALLMNLAELHTLQLDFPAAEPFYRQVIRSEPENVVALNNLAWILAPRSEAAEEALACVEKAIELLGPTGELLDTRARILIARGEVDRAIGDLNEALGQSQTSLRYFHLAVAQFKKLNKTGAEKSFKEAVARGLDPKEIHPSDMPTYKVLASAMGEH